MEHYEIVFMVHPQHSDRVPSLVDKYKSIVQDRNGHIHRLEDWGLRTLAYPIQKLKNAHYVLLNLECDADSLAEIKEDFRFNEILLRNLILRKSEAITDPSPVALLMKRGAERAAKQGGQSAPEGKTEGEADPKAKPRAESKAKPRAESKAKPEAESKAKSRAESKAKPEAESKAKPRAESKAKPEAESKAKPEAESKAKPKAESKAKPEAESQSKTRG